MNDFKCGHKPEKHEAVSFDHVIYPYNPAWPLQHRDAGIFCSVKCLVQYLADGLDDEGLAYVQTSFRGGLQTHPGAPF